MLAYINGRPLHVLSAKDDDLGRCIVVTAYEPDKGIWELGFKFKKK